MNQTTSVQTSRVRPDMLRLCAIGLTWFLTGIAIGAASKGLVLFGRTGAWIAGGPGLWITILSVIGYYSVTPRIAAIRAVITTPGMLIGFYTAFQLIEGGFPQTYALMWSIVTMLGCPMIATLGAIARRADWFGSLAVGLITGSLVADILDTGVLSGGERTGPISAYDLAHPNYGPIAAAVFNALAAITIMLRFCPDNRRRLQAIPLVAIGVGIQLALIQLVVAISPYVSIVPGI